MKTALLIILIFVTFFGHQLTSVAVYNNVDGTEINKNDHRLDGPNRISPAYLTQHHDPVKEDTSYRWLTPEGPRDAVNHDAANLVKSGGGSSYCDMFYMLVSTIDGRVSALDLHDKGSLVWSVQADARPLYSSSLTNMEEDEETVLNRKIL